ncbi:AMP-binding protein [Streptomyces sp. NPDC058247]|uniref:AMP-binding protein n=1 Tax=Streptomyces sp. NPDC058247 TaxID=3346401 RepID=UPI0036EFB526
MRHDLEFRSIPAMVRASASRFADGEALADLDDGRRWSFREVADEMVRAARAVRALGVKPGDRVAVWGPNCPEWIFAALGVQAAGGVLVPLNTRFKAAEAEYILRKSGAGTVFTVTGFLGADYLGMLPEGVRAVVMRGGKATGGALGWEEFLALGERVDERAVLGVIEGLGPDDVSDIMFTPGTTGRPKGVVLGHGQSLRAYGWLSDVFTFRPGDRFLIIPPFFHTFGYKAGWLACLMQGVTTLPQPVFDAGQVLERIERERVSILLGPPTLFEDLMRHPRRAARLLGAHPSVAEVAVIGVPDERLGEVGAAFVVRGDASLTEEELVAWVREHMANYKAPRRIAFVDTLPRNASMKLEKGRLRALLVERPADSLE